MTRITLDPTIVAKLRELEEPAKLCDHSGQILGEFWPASGRLPEGLECPISEEEIERRRNDPTTYTTPEVLERLESL
jgi:hypothetical protein